jgi:short-subunit dehydrogenase
MDVQDKVAIITGASSGIGLATSMLLAEKGGRLALAARSREKLESLSKRLHGSLAVPTDMTKPDEIKRMIEQTQTHFGRIDILINNAGQGYDAPVEFIDIDTLHHIFDLNLVGPLTAMQQVIPLMRNEGGGAIINISSGAALMRLPNMSPYSSLKSALAVLSLTAREELKGDHIIVSVVYPYITLTDFEKNTIKHCIDDESGEEGGAFSSGDTADYVAHKIIECIVSGEAEVFAHDWMKNPGR